jgi:hypothetical protein
MRLSIEAQNKGAQAVADALFKMDRSLIQGSALPGIPVLPRKFGRYSEILGGG